jgi:hypothetical protein
MGVRKTQLEIATHQEKENQKYDLSCSVKRYFFFVQNAGRI